MEKLKKEAIYLNNDEEFVKFLDDETEDRLFINTFIEMGIEQNNLEIAKKMLQENFSEEIISKITGLSIKEINDLK